jgi:hypothetical protein
MRSAHRQGTPRGQANVDQAWLVFSLCQHLYAVLCSASSHTVTFAFVSSWRRLSSECGCLCKLSILHVCRHLLNYELGPCMFLSCVLKP